MREENRDRGRVAVVTGGSRGIGAGLVKAFAEAGWEVLFSGRGEESVAGALARLPAELRPRVQGRVCEADDRTGLERLWEAAAARGRVEVVLCNAGRNVPRPDFAGHEEADIREVVDTNLLGPMLAATVFLPRLEAQGGGFFYAMEGLGSQGEIMPGATLYGASKYALAYLLRALAKESRGTKVSIGALSPGMVVTDLLLARQGGLAGAAGLPEGQKRVFSILADRVETVAPWLVGRILADVAAGARPGRYRRFAWLTKRKAALRFATAAFVKRRVFD